MCKRTNRRPGEELATVQCLFGGFNREEFYFFCKETELDMLVSHFYMLHSFDEKEVGH